MAVMMKAVNSSNVAEIGYNQKTNEVHVLFHDGGYYIYGSAESPVPEELFVDFTLSESKGRFVHTHLDKQFPHRPGPE